MVDFLTVEDSLQLAAGSFNIERPRDQKVFPDLALLMVSRKSSQVTSFQTLFLSIFNFHSLFFIFHF
jgi:hypothetical protein